MVKIYDFKKVKIIVFSIGLSVTVNMLKYQLT